MKVKNEKYGSFITCLQILWCPSLQESESEVTQLCPTFCNPMDCSLPGSSIHGIFQARILEWIAISFSRRSSQPRDWTQVSRIVGRCFTIWATREVLPCRRLCLISRPLNVDNDKIHETWFSRRQTSKKIKDRGFLSGSVAKTPHSWYRGSRFNLWSGS